MLFGGRLIQPNSWEITLGTRKKPLTVNFVDGAFVIETHYKLTKFEASTARTAAEFGQRYP